MPLRFAAPLTAAALYAFAALALKRATGNGAGPWRVSFVANWFQAVVFAPIWLLGGGEFAWIHLGHCVLTGMIFFIGQVFTFLALSRGDVSVATPVLGTKVVFVALLTVVLMHQPVPAPWWWAAVLTMAATALLGGAKSAAGKETFARSLTYGFSAAAAFALTDVLAQKWAQPWGFAHFAPVMFLTVAVCSLLLIPAFRAPLWELPAATWRWLIPGSLLLGAQATGIAYSIMTFGDATMVNILYASRGVWTVLLVWVVGHWFGNEERGHGHAVMGRRLAGAGLLVLAVFLVVK